MRERHEFQLSVHEYLLELGSQGKRSETTVEDWERYHLVWTVAFGGGFRAYTGDTPSFAQSGISIRTRPLVTPRAGTVFEEKLYGEAMPTGGISQYDLRAVAEYELAKTS